MAIIQVKRIPEKDPRNATKAFRLRLATKKQVTPVIMVTITKETRIGSYPLRKLGRRTFQIIKMVKRNDKIAFAPVHPPKITSKRIKILKSRSSVLTR